MKNTTKINAGSKVKKPTAKKAKSETSYWGKVEGITVPEAVIAILHRPIKGGVDEGFGGGPMVDLFEEVRALRPRTTQEEYCNAVHALTERDIIDRDGEGRISIADSIRNLVVHAGN